MPFMKFSTYLKKLRDERNITKADLARALGITTQYIVDVEAGRGKPPTVERCEQISRTLRLSDGEKNHLFRLAAVERLSGSSLHYLEKILQSSKPGLKVKDSDPEEFVRHLKKAITRQGDKTETSGSPKTLVNVPLLKTAPSGGKKFSYERAERWIPLPKEILEDREIFLFEASGDSMAGAGIGGGDIVIVEAYAPPQKADLVLAEINGEVLIRRFYRYGKTIVLEPADPKYEKSEIPAKTSFRLFGVLRGVLWP